MPVNVNRMHMNPSANGETKREKAFWMVYNTMILMSGGSETTYEQVASTAIEAVSVGFKALESE